MLLRLLASSEHGGDALREARTGSHDAGAPTSTDSTDPDEAAADSTYEQALEPAPLRRPLQHPWWHPPTDVLEPPVSN